MNQEEKARKWDKEKKPRPDLNYKSKLMSALLISLDRTQYNIEIRVIAQLLYLDLASLWYSANF